MLNKLSVCETRSLTNCIFLENIMKEKHGNFYLVIIDTIFVRLISMVSRSGAL